MVKLALLPCATFAAAALFAQQALVKHDSAEEEFRESVLDHDPSLVACTNDSPSQYWPGPYHERWRVVTDLNGDGIDDLILSEPMRYFGTGGGCWDAYYNVSNRLWRRVGDVGMKPWAFTMDKMWNEVDLWYHWHSSACEGSIGYHTFTKDGMRKKNEQMSIRSAGEGSADVFSGIDAGIFG